MLKVAVTKVAHSLTANGSGHRDESYRPLLHEVTVACYSRSPTPPWTPPLNHGKVFNKATNVLLTFSLSFLLLRTQAHYRILQVVITTRLDEKKMLLSVCGN